jgi:hypothetical protein
MRWEREIDHGLREREQFKKKKKTISVLVFELMRAIL